MNGSGFGRSLRIAAAALAGVIAVSAVVPAMADDHDRDRREHERHDRDRHEWRGHYYGTPGYVAPAPVYAPPAVVYSPPPAALYAPPVVPTVNFVFPLRF
jgi:hypothetical protein